MTNEEHETRLKRIEQLKDCPGWTEYLRPRLAAVLLAVEREVLENDKLKAKEVMRKRAEARALRTALNTPETDAKVSADTLRRKQT